MPVVALRKCPACGGGLMGLAGVPWMTCRDCPTAWDLFAGPPVRVSTHRPAGERATSSARLPFFVFIGSAAGSVVWVPAYRAAPDRSDGDIASLLTGRKHRVPFGEAPLGAAVARGPREATAQLRLRAPGSFTADDALPVLVSLPCRLEAGVLTEPVSGGSLEVARTWPKPV